MKRQQPALSLVESIQRNRQRIKCRWILHKIQLRVFDYQDKGPEEFARYQRVRNRVATRLKGVQPCSR